MFSALFGLFYLYGSRSSAMALLFHTRSTAAVYTNAFYDVADGYYGVRRVIRTGGMQDAEEKCQSLEQLQ